MLIEPLSDWWRERQVNYRHMIPESYSSTEIGLLVDE